MKIWQKPLQTLIISTFALSLSQISLAEESTSSPDQLDLELDQSSTMPNNTDISPTITPANPDETKPSNDDSDETDEKIELSPWSASMFYLYNFSNNKQLLVPTPGYEKGGFKANAQKASYDFNKFYDFQTQVSTDWSIGNNDEMQDKLIFKTNASIKRRLVVAVPFLQVSQGLSFEKNYNQISTGASSFIPTPWFFILPKYTATYNSADMNHFEFGVNQEGWSSGWGVTLLKPINDQWTFLTIYSGRKLSDDLSTSISKEEQNKQSVMMILSYQFDKDFKLFNK